MIFPHDKVIVLVEAEFLSDKLAEADFIPNFDLFGGRASGQNDPETGLFGAQELQKCVFFNLRLDDQAVLEGLEVHFFFGAEFLGAAAWRLTE